MGKQGRGGGSSAWLALAALVLLSAAIRAVASREVTTPWIAPDEMVYGLLGTSLYHRGTLGILGDPSGFLSAVVPAVFGLPLSLPNLELGYSLLKILGAVVMSLAAVPTFLWARTLVSVRWALAAAALTLALPGLAYAGLIMSEVVFYPLLTLAAWSIAAVLEAPTVRRQLAVCAVVALAILTRPQAVMLVPAFLIAIAFDSALDRSWPRLCRFVPTLAGFAAGAAGWALAISASGGPVLGGYRGAARHYSLGHALAYIAYHLGDVVLLTGVFPACAVGVFLASSLRRGERDPRVRAYLASAAGLTCATVVEVGVFASGNVGHLAERNLIGLAPMLFVGFAVWLSRGGPGSRRARLSVALVAVGTIAAIPAGRFITASAIVDEFSLIPLYHLRELASLDVTVVALDACVAIAAVLFAFLPRRYLLVLPGLVGLVLVSGSFAASRQVVNESRVQRSEMVGPVRRWIDGAATGPVAYLYDASRPFNAVWQAIFWNRRIQDVYDLPGSFVAGPLPQQSLTIEPDGKLQAADGPSPKQAFAVAPQAYQLVGKPVAYSPTNADQSGLGLWKVDPPLRISAVAFGLQPNGDIDPRAGNVVAGLKAYDCRGGSFELTLLVKQPGTIRIALDGLEARKRTFEQPTQWRVAVPAAASSAQAGTCRLTIRPTGLTGATRLTFVRR